MANYHTYCPLCSREFRGNYGKALYRHLRYDERCDHQHAWEYVQSCFDGEFDASPERQREQTYREARESQRRESYRDTA